MNGCKGLEFQEHFDLYFSDKTSPIIEDESVAVYFRKTIGLLRIIV